MTKPAIEIFADAGALAERAAGLFVQAARDAIAARGRFAVALAGGTTPEKTYERLAQSPHREGVDWTKTYVFLGDERFVSADDDRSNYGMARRSLLTHVPVPPENVFPVLTEAPTAGDAAAHYAETLARVFGIPRSGPPPAFDLILLGLGDDGHTASIFPGHVTPDYDEAWVLFGPPGILPPPVDRITFTFRTINAARCVLFLVAGEKKAPAVRDILEGGASREEHPASGVHPVNGTLPWLLDEAAANLLTKP